MGKKQVAFTLVELLVVIAIIGLIATLSVIALGNARSKSRDSKRVSDIKQIQTALELFFSDQGRYPTLEEWNTGSLYATGTFGTTTYMERVPQDPVLGNYYYISFADGRDYNLNFHLDGAIGSYNNRGIFNATSQGVSYQGLDDELVSWWKMDQISNNSVLDYGLAKHAGQLFGEPIITDDPLRGPVLLLDGNNDYVLVGDYDVYDFSANDFTIMAWINKPVVTDGYKGFIMSKWNNGFYSGTNEFIFGVINSSDPSPVGIIIENNISRSAIAGTTSPLAINTWYQIVAVRESNNIKIYLNGSLERTTNIGGVAINNSGRNLVFGAFGLTPSYNTNIFLDDLRIYSKGLSANEIKTIYDSTK